ncbi:MAG TPA: heterodisulfide reductase-related iron-sulfur binding cluster [Vicinamibacterales bacterium]|nr:heterodisulfide reductase-related iron-sulfur binding cluster [Vicinamibacterales bacterium]
MEQRTTTTFTGPDLPSRGLVDACVHCGFCLPSCPTYLLWGEEMDSPRGRIYLLKAGLENRTAMTPTFVEHFDRCLGCLACVTACPSGVQYGPLIERTRAQIERRFSRPVGDRLFRALLMAVLPYPARLRLALLPLVLFRPLAGAIARAGLLPARLRAAVAVAPPVGWRSLAGRIAVRTPASGTPRMTVGVLTGCVQRIAFGDVNRATVRVLAAEGCTVEAPAGQGCCGALPLHAGHIDQARALARRNIAVFEAAGVDRLVVNAAGCGSAMKEYGELFAGDPEWEPRARACAAKVRDVSELLAELGDPRAPRHPIAARVAYHDACHLAHGQGVRTEPRALLQAIPGLEVLTPAESEICCGSAGIYNLVQPEAASVLGARKVRHIAALAPDLVATGNPGCTLQIAAAARGFGYNWPVVHPIQLVDASIRGIDPKATGLGPQAPGQGRG